MADNDDKRDRRCRRQEDPDTEGRSRPGQPPRHVALVARTVVVEKRTRVVPPRRGAVRVACARRVRIRPQPASTRRAAASQPRAAAAAGAAPPASAPPRPMPARRVLREAGARQAEDAGALRSRRSPPHRGRCAAAARSAKPRRAEEDAPRAPRSSAIEAERRRCERSRGARPSRRHAGRRPAAAERRRSRRASRRPRRRRAGAAPPARPRRRVRARAHGADRFPPAPPSEADGRRARTAPAAASRPRQRRRARECPPRQRAPRPSVRPARPATRMPSPARRLTVTNAGTETDRDTRPVARRHAPPPRQEDGPQPAGRRPSSAREVIIPEAITVQELANRMAERAVDVIKMLMAQDQMVKINDVIDSDTAELIATELGHTVKRVSDADVEEGLYDIPADDKAEDLTNRAAGRDHHGPRRPRQDLAARRHPRDQRGLGRSRRHHPAHRRLPGRKERPEDHLPRYPGPRGVHRHACPRRAGDRYRGAGGGGRRRRHAADHRVHQARQGGRGSDHRRHQQDGQARRQSARASAPNCCSTKCSSNRWAATMLDVEVSAVKKTGLDKLLETILLQAEVLELQGGPRRPRRGPRHRSQARSRPRCGGDRAGAARHAQRRRHRRRRHRVRPRPRADRRQGRAGQGSRPLDPGRGAGLYRRAARPATASRSSRPKRGPARSPNTASA